jgi:hypothetical protein
VKFTKRHTRIEKPSIIDFVTDPQLLGLSISDPQRVLLKSIYGLLLTKHELEIFRLCTGRQEYPRHGLRSARPT